MEKNRRPNIFEIATSELSQDAFITWLLQWANPEFMNVDEKICKLGQLFISLLTGIKAEEIKSIEAGRQWKNIDIWCEINDDTFLVIEDKVYTSEHSGQLSRYRKIVEEWYKGKRSNLIFVYLKTGNASASELDKINNEDSYKTVNRKELLDCLSTYNGNNSIILDFIRYWSPVEEDTDSYKTLPVREWNTDYAWQGFYTELEKSEEMLNKGFNWKIIYNRSNPYLGAQWLWADGKDKIETENGSEAEFEFELSLHFNQKELCFKIALSDESKIKGSLSRIRNKYHNKLINLSREKHPEIVKPTRFGTGLSMTIGVVPIEKLIVGEYPQFMTNLKAKLKQYEALIGECISAAE